MWWRFWQRKASAAGRAVGALNSGSATWPQFDAQRFVQQGVLQNWVIFACVTKIVDAVGDLVPIVLDERGEEQDPKMQGELAGLLDRPAPTIDRGAFMRMITLQYLVAGQAFIEAVPRTRSESLAWIKKDLPVQLFVLRSDNMRVEPGERGFPLEFVFGQPPNEVHFPVDQITGKSRILQIRREHPLDDFNGMSVLYAVAKPSDVIEQMMLNLYNTARAGQPSGILMVEDAAENEIEMLRAKLRQMALGDNQAGQMLALAGRASWLPTGLNATDVGATENMREMARAICNVFGVPPPLVLAGESTYSNREQARQEFYEYTVVPLGERIFGALARWMTALTERRYDIRVDLDQIPALATARQMHRAAVVQEYQAGLVTRNEARAALGYDEVDPEKGDTFATDPPPMEQNGAPAPPMPAEGNA